jgi:Flp pilus assembly pilin Flp
LIRIEERQEYWNILAANQIIAVDTEENFMMIITRFLQDEQGQDLIEYTLLLAFVCLASAALFVSAGGSVSGIWSATNSQLAVANTSAS